MIIIINMPLEYIDLDLNIHTIYVQITHLPLIMDYLISEIFHIFKFKSTKTIYSTTQLDTFFFHLPLTISVKS